MAKPLVIILMGSKSDLEYCQKIEDGCKGYGIETVLRIGSAHKTAEHVLAILREYEADARPKVYITVAGRSNALSGFTDGLVSAPVIACPPPAMRLAVRMYIHHCGCHRELPRRSCWSLPTRPCWQRKSWVWWIPRYRRLLTKSQKQAAEKIDPGRSGARMNFLCDDHPQEECGLIGIFAPNEDVARMAYFGLFALQHRGQEAAGIAVSDGVTMSMHKNVGLIAQVFSPNSLESLPGKYAIGHTRYSTTGSSSIRNAQPFMIETLHGPLALGHNGNLVNSPSCARRLLEGGVGLSASSDSEVLTMMLARAQGDTWEERIKACMQDLVGGLFTGTSDAGWSVMRHVTHGDSGH